MITIEMIAYLQLLQGAVGHALPLEQQLWVSAQYPQLPAFLASEEGRIAVQQFVADWKACVEKPA